MRVNVIDDDENEGRETLTLTLTDAQLPLEIVPGYDEAVLTAIDLDGMIMLIHNNWAVPGRDCALLFVSLLTYE